MIFEKVCMLVSEQFDVSEDSLELNTSLYDDLGADELDFVELIMALEEEFELFGYDESIFHDIKNKTIGEIVSIISEIHDDI